MKVFKRTSSAELQWDVFVAPSKPVVTDDVPPGFPRRMWSPTSATLISGKRDAVLVDPLMTIEETRALSDWIDATGKHLTTIYVTHGHGDHSFGISILRERFPDARAVATPRVLQHMRKQAAPDFLESFWKSRFPRQLPDELVFPDALEGDELDLEGQDLLAVDLGHTAESSPQGRREWIAALDKIESLRPRAVIAGHKRAGNDDDPRIVEETRKYIRDFDRVAEERATARDLYDAMRALYPDRVNPGALWSSARAVKP
jgi:glyoxylase-like metal-dependent hydrolase (beta-lactamase superfamily II)